MKCSVIKCNVMLCIDWMDCNAIWCYIKDALWYKRHPEPPLPLELSFGLESNIWTLSIFATRQKNVQTNLDTNMKTIVWQKKYWKGVNFYRQ